MQRHAEPCRTLRATTRMHAHAHAHARGIRLQGNRFGRFGSAASESTDMLVASPCVGPTSRHVGPRSHAFQKTNP